MSFIGATNVNDENQKTGDGNNETVTDEQQSDSTDTDTGTADDSASTGDHQDDEHVVVTIGDEETPDDEESRAPEWVRELRKSQRELKKENLELKTKLNQGHSSSPDALGKKPTLEDHDYDAEKFETALSEWYDRKRAADQAAATAEAEKANQQKAWQSKLDAYGQAKTELKVKDYEDAEAAIQDILDVTQQGLILQGADNPAIVIYALGKNQKLAKTLAAIKDPVKFIHAIGKMETDGKMEIKLKTKTAPPPERQVSGTAPISGSVDSTLERLRADAAKTNDYTKVIQYKRQKKAAA